MSEAVNREMNAMDAMDANGDGKISRDEFLEHMAWTSAVGALMTQLPLYCVCVCDIHTIQSCSILHATCCMKPVPCVFHARFSVASHAQQHDTPSTHNPAPAYDEVICCRLYVMTWHGGLGRGSRALATCPQLQAAMPPHIRHLGNCAK